MINLSSPVEKSLLKSHMMARVTTGGECDGVRKSHVLLLHAMTSKIKTIRTMKGDNKVENGSLGAILSAVFETLCS